MRLNRTTRIGLAFLTAAVLLFGIRALFNSFGPPTAPAGNTANTIATDNTANQARRVDIGGGSVYVARENIPERSILTADMFRPYQLPSGTPTQGYVTDLPTQAVGYITAAAIPANNRLRTTALLGHISDIGIAGAIRPGLRAIVVPITNKVTFHDLVKIGSYVDVIGSFDGQEARAVVQNVRVLAVDVFGKDYPQTSVAARGDYKAPPASVREDTPGSPGGVSSPGGNAVGAPANATPTPAPANPPGRPEAALTLEVTPQQAASLALAQASGAPLEYLLRPRDLGIYAGGAGSLGTGGTNGTTGASGTGAGSDDLNTMQVVSVTRAQLAPYAERLKHQKAASTASSGSSSSRSSSSGREARQFSPPPIPRQRDGGFIPADPGSLRPVATPVPPTYEIPIYGDGKFVRSDTVRNPAASPQ